MSRTISGDVSEFERRLGLPAGFYDRLLKEDDWSFVIKLNSLFEAACAHILTVRLNSPELGDAFAHLDFANSKSGKIAMLKATNAITPEQFNILRSLAELRNLLVHNISNVGFTFKSHVAGLDKNKLKTMVRTFGHGITETIDLGTVKVPRDAFVAQNMKFTLWVTCAELLACLYLEHEIAEFRLKTEAIDRYFEVYGGAWPPLGHTPDAGES